RVHFGPLNVTDKAGEVMQAAGTCQEIGWEFGSSSLIDLCIEKKVDFIVVRGIADFTNESKPDASAAQRSVTNAAKFILHGLEFAPFERVAAPTAAMPTPEPAAGEAFYVESLHLTNFRCFDQIEIPFRRESRLKGEWTCVAGINGSGKSSILQALCLVLLGPEVKQIGDAALNRMRRVHGAERLDADIEATLRTVATHREIRLWLKIGANGMTSASSDPPLFWDTPRKFLLTSYGASRNLSSRSQSGYENWSQDLRRQVTLFDPLSQLAVADVLLERASADIAFRPFFLRVLEHVFAGELVASGGESGMRFNAPRREAVEAIDLPDGYRSSAAWLADLCAIWCEKAPELAAKGDPAEMQGIVLIDEIDLHLHPSLQRSLIPRLRELMPKVQWIATTHSPLILGNFDSNEIIALDQNEEGNVRLLDRQILGFSADEIYRWLMGTESGGEQIERMEEENEDEMAEWLDSSPKISAADAKARVSKLKKTIERLKP
ncbi:MAG TPA: AAA family ATPase, partial [Bryobacteraceae bacterium]